MARTPKYLKPHSWEYGPPDPKVIKRKEECMEVWKELSPYHFTESVDMSSYLKRTSSMLNNPEYSNINTTPIRNKILRYLKYNSVYVYSIEIYNRRHLSTHFLYDKDRWDIDKILTKVETLIRESPDGRCLGIVMKNGLHYNKCDYYCKVLHIAYHPQDKYHPWLKNIWVDVYK